MEFLLAFWMGKTSFVDIPNRHISTYIEPEKWPAYKKNVTNANKTCVMISWSRSLPQTALHMVSLVSMWQFFKNLPYTSDYVTLCSKFLLLNWSISPPNILLAMMWPNMLGWFLGLLPNLFQFNFILANNYIIIAYDAKHLVWIGMV